MTKIFDRAREMKRKKEHCKGFCIRYEKTQREIAEELDVYESQVSFFVNGNSWHQKIADYFGYRREVN